jgi:hypothetical protein
LQVARWTEPVKGFGHVKDRHLRAARLQLATLWTQWQAQELPPAGDDERRVA